MDNVIFIQFKLWGAGPGNEFLLSVESVAVPQVGQTVTLIDHKGNERTHEVRKVCWKVEQTEVVKEDPPGETAVDRWCKGRDLVTEIEVDVWLQ